MGKVSKGSCIPLDQGCQVDRNRHLYGKRRRKDDWREKGGNIEYLTLLLFPLFPVRVQYCLYKRWGQRCMKMIDVLLQDAYYTLW